MYKRLFSSNTYKRFPKQTIPLSYRVPDVLRRVRRDSYCKSTTPYYGEGDGGWDMGVGLDVTRQYDYFSITINYGFI